MIPPTTVVQTIMSALQMNDYPEENDGIRIAYMFSKPHGCEGLLAGQVHLSLPVLLPWLTFIEY